MIVYRSFHNDDTPHLIDIWRAQPRQRGLAQPVAAELFEQLVLSKPYFENAGLILAIDEEEAVGFVHAGFGPTDDGSGLNRRFGVISLLMVKPTHAEGEVGAQLLARAEEYLREHGAEVLYAGGIRPLDPFYVGLYGGSELPGVLASDTFARGVYQAAGYQEIDRVIVLARELAGFRAPVDRLQMQIRRNSIVEEQTDAPPRNWWEACALAPFHVTAFQLIESGRGQPSATARFWMLDTFAAGWGVQAAGLYELEVVPDRQHCGLAKFLVSDAFRRLAAGGVSLIEAQTMQGNSVALALYHKLGFAEVDSGVVLRKQQ